MQVHLNFDFIATFYIPVIFLPHFRIILGIHIYISRQYGASLSKTRLIVKYEPNVFFGGILFWLNSFAIEDKEKM